MAVKSKEPEKVDGEVLTLAKVSEQGSIKFRLINPTEDGFLQVIKWNKEELEAAVRQKIAVYENVVYSEDNIKQAKTDRAMLNKLVKAIDERRKSVKKIINEPYEKFEAELKEITALIHEPIGLIDKQVKIFEEQQKDEKKNEIQKSYNEVIGDLTEILPFDMVFDTKYLKQTYKLAAAQADVKAKVEKVRIDLETIDNLESKYKLNAKDVYIKTLDISKALAENKRLSDLEEKLETEEKRRAYEKAERKSLEDKHRIEAEKKAKAEEQNKALEIQEKAKMSITKQHEGVVKNAENILSKTENVSENQESVLEPVVEVEKTIQGIEQQRYMEATEPFVPQQKEKIYRTKFYVKGTKEQLGKLVQFMNENRIEYGRIN